MARTTLDTGTRRLPASRFSSSSSTAGTRVWSTRSFLAERRALRRSRFASVSAASAASAASACSASAGAAASGSVAASSAGGGVALFVVGLVCHAVIHNTVYHGVKS